MQNQYYLEYVSRINKAIDFIDNNLDNELTLEAIAEVANFSKFHFHRIFSSFVGETLFDFIQRIRIEKAAAKLIGDRSAAITEIAFDVGFNNISAFSRAFKRVFGDSPTEYRKKKYSECNLNSNLSTQNSNTKQTIGNNGKMQVDTLSYFRNVNFLQNNLRISNMFTESEMNVVVRDLPETTVAYVRYIGPYAGNEELFKGLFAKLFAWAGARGLLARPDFKVLSIYHDDPHITEEAKLRTSICLTVPEDTKVDGDIGKMEIPAGKYAMGRFEMDATDYGKAWSSICGVWLPNSGYAPADGPCFELYLNDHNKHPEGKHIVDICIPVKPL